MSEEQTSDDKPQSLAERLWSESDWKGIRLDRYEITDILGGGGMGRVFLANDVILQRDVALKIIEQVLDEAMDSGFLELFLREAQAVARLEHPNIVRVYDVVHSEGVIAIAMEYVRGGTLSDLIKSEEMLPIPEVCRIISEAAEGLHYAHENGLVHRDVKPANLMLNEKRQCKVVDFGATHDQDQVDISMFRGKLVGSPHFVSPEVIQGKKPTPASDIYSLGVVLWCSLVKDPPFTSKERRDLYMKHLKSRLPDISKFRDDIPSDLKKLVEGCLKKKIPSRIDSCNYVAKTLRQIGSDFAEQENSEIARMSAAIDDTTVSIPHRHRHRKIKVRGRTAGARLSSSRPVSRVGKHASKSHGRKAGLVSRKKNNRPLMIGVVIGVVILLIVMIILVISFLPENKPPGTGLKPSSEYNVTNEIGDSYE